MEIAVLAQEKKLAQNAHLKPCVFLLYYTCLKQQNKDIGAQWNKAKSKAQKTGGSFR